VINVECDPTYREQRREAVRALLCALVSELEHDADDAIWLLAHHGMTRDDAWWLLEYGDQKLWTVAWSPAGPVGEEPYPIHVRVRDFVPLAKAAYVSDRVILPPAEIS
jgi:hypothetical protein